MAKGFKIKAKKRNKDLEKQIKKQRKELKLKIDSGDLDEMALKLFKKWRKQLKGVSSEVELTLTSAIFHVKTVVLINQMRVAASQKNPEVGGVVRKEDAILQPRRRKGLNKYTKKK